MPDRQRARVLAQICACVIIALLYALGGFSLYLRARYLGSVPTSMPTPTPLPEIATTTAPEATTPTLRPTSTLYPTITPDLTRTAMAGPVARAQAAPKKAMALALQLSP